VHSTTYRHHGLLLFVVAGLACGASHNPVAPTPEDDVSTATSVSTVRRAPDPGEGERLPLPNMLAVVQQIAREHPEALRHSCQPDGGTWEFMDLVVETLREQDTRWAYNAKRGDFHDLSHDVVFYHWGAGPSEGSTEGYVVDIIVDHCGDHPGPAWWDATDETFRAGTTGGYIYPRP
jgi:hypothetical protein